MNPVHLLERLQLSATARKRRSLQTIFDTCQEQEERGSKDFSIATIGRLSEQRDGPITQTIRNAGGIDYRGLIEAWANHSGGSLKKPKKKNENPIAAILDKIPDVAVRALVGTMMAENTKLRGQVNLLKHQAEVVIDQRPTAHQSEVEVLPYSLNLTESERAALTHAISEGALIEHRWSAGRNGRIINEKGSTIYKPGYISGITKVLADQPNNLTKPG